MGMDTKPTHMPLDRDIIGRVGENQIHHLAASKPVERLLISCITADEPVSAQQPHIPLFRDSGTFHAVWDHILCIRLLPCHIRCRFACVIQNKINLSRLKSQKLNIKGHIHESLQLYRENIPVPASIQGQLVVSENIGPAFILAQVLQGNDGDTLQPQLLCCFHTAMACHDAAILSNQHRVGKPEAFDAFSDLFDLPA